MGALETMWKEGKTSAKEIGQILGTTKGSVIGKANRMNLGAKKRIISKTQKKKPLRIPIKKPIRQKLPPDFVPISEMTEFRPEPDYNSPVILSKIRSKQCCWPLGEPTEKGNMLCCGKKRIPRKSYCQEHAEKAYQKPKKEEINVQEER